MSKRQKRSPKRELVHVVPVFFLDCVGPFRIQYVAGIEALDENWAPPHVKECMKQLLEHTAKPYNVPYIQVYPLPAGYRPGDALAWDPNYAGNYAGG